MAEMNREQKRPRHLNRSESGAPLECDWAKEVVAITGVSGSGKSQVVRQFAALGAFVVDADQLAREVVAPGSSGLQRVVESFGAGVLASDGTLDRRALRAIVFADPGLRLKLEGLLHPLIAQRAQELFSSPAAKSAKLRIYDVPLLFEAGLDQAGFKSIVVVSAPPERCIERIMQRDSISRDEAESRLSAQIPIEEKCARAEHVLRNDSSIDALQAQIGELYRRLI